MLLNMLNYATRLSRLYQKVSAKISAQAAEKANQWAHQLAKVTDINLTGSLATLQPETVELAAVRTYVQELYEAGQQALAELAVKKEQLSVALAHYDQALSALNAAPGPSWDESKAQGAIDTYFIAVTQRTQQLVPKLAEMRYEPEIYKMALINDVLNTEKLLALLNELTANCALEQEHYWRAQASVNDIALTGVPPMPSVDVNELAQLFLTYIQLQWERPSMLKKMMQVLSQERYPEKLQAEMAAGQVAISAEIMRKIRHIWDELGAHLLRIGQLSVAGWLQTNTGMTRPMCVQKMAQLNEQQNQLEEWIAGRMECIPECVFQHWQGGLQSAAIGYVGRLLKEKQSGAGR